MNQYIKKFYKSLLEDDDIKTNEPLYLIYKYSTFKLLLRDENFSSESVSINPTEIIDNMQSLVKIRQTIGVDICFDDIKDYINPTQQYYVEHPDESCYNYKYSFAEENLEYDCGTDTLHISNSLLSKLVLRKDEYFNLTMCVYDAHKVNEYPSFILGVSTDSDIPLLKDLLSFNRTEMKVNKFIEEAHLMRHLDGIYGDCYIHFMNIPFEMIERIKAKSKLIYYSLDDEQYHILDKNIEEIDELLNSYCDNGNMNPLLLDFSLDEDFSKVVKCNESYLFSKILKYPSIMCIIVSKYSDELPDDLTSESKTKYLKEMEEFFSPYLTYKIAEKDRSNRYEIQDSESVNILYDNIGDSNMDL